MGRGRHEKTQAMMDAIAALVTERKPITVRGIAYQLFAQGLIPSMAKAQTQAVSRVVVTMREEGALPWAWVVDDGRPERRAPSWDDPEAFMASVLQQYRKNFWLQQPFDVRVWSEKSTVYGVLAPVLDRYAAPFQAHKGFSSATALYDAAQATRQASSRYQSVLLYVGDYDPSGYHMSQVDLPARLARYGGAAVVERIALTPEDGAAEALPSFPVETKKADPRYRWWVQQGCGPRCWELDAMNPNRLRTRVEGAIRAYLDLGAWERCQGAEAAELASMTAFFEQYPILHQVAQ
jgi:hypothetical protein